MLCAPAYPACDPSDNSPNPYKVVALHPVPPAVVWDTRTMAPKTIGDLYLDCDFYRCWCYYYRRLGDVLKVQPRAGPGCRYTWTSYLMVVYADDIVTYSDEKHKEGGTRWS